MRQSILLAIIGFIVLPLSVQAEEDRTLESRDAELNELLEEGVKKLESSKEAMKTSSEYHYKVAQQQYNGTIDMDNGDPTVEMPAERKRDLMRAYENLVTALEYNPANTEAKELLIKVKSRLGVPEDKAIDWLRNEANAKDARLAATVAKIQNRYNKANRLFENKKYEMAIKEYKHVLDELEFAPFHSSIKDLKPMVLDKLNKVHAAIKARDIAREEQAKMEARSRAMEQIHQQEAMRQRTINTLFEKAKIHFDAHEYDRCITVAHKVLSLDPDHKDAQYLIDKSNEIKNVTLRHTISRKKEDGNQRQHTVEEGHFIINDPSVPMQFPDDFLEKAAKRHHQLFSQRESTQADWKTRLKSALGRPATTGFEERPLSQVFQQLRSTYEVAILPDPDVIEDQDQLITLPVRNMTFEQVLDILVSLIDAGGTELGWTLKFGGIWIGDKSTFNEDSTLVHYDVRDLIGILRDFYGPEISLASGDDGGISIEEAESETDEEVTGDDLKELVENTIDPESWGNNNHTIEIRNGSIVVNHTPKVHEQIQDMLSFMRKQRALQVHIQARFLLVNDLDFSHIGVDWSGLQLAPSQNANFNQFGNGGNDNLGYSTLEDFPPASSTTAAGFSNSLGFISETNSVGRSSDFRGRLMNFLGNGYTVYNGMSAANAMNTGIAMSFQFLNDFQASALLRATQMKQKQTNLVAPMVTCFNTQRANVSVMQQQAYVKDLTAVVTVGFALFDPEIGYVQSGTTLDVRPIVSHDRKYVTLELRPTVAQLLGFTFIPVSNPNQQFNGSSGAAKIQAPRMSFRAIRTTVSVPDGGTLLMGGYSTGNETDDYSGLPLFSKIPVLNSLLGSSLRDRTKVDHYMMVKANIIDQSEQERDRFGVIN